MFNYVFFNLINYVVTYDGTIINKAGIVFNVCLLTFDDIKCVSVYRNSHLIREVM